MVRLTKLGILNNWLVATTRTYHDSFNSQSASECRGNKNGHKESNNTIENPNSLQTKIPRFRNSFFLQFSFRRSPRRKRVPTRYLSFSQPEGQRGSFMSNFYIHNSLQKAMFVPMLVTQYQTRIKENWSDVQVSIIFRRFWVKI